MSKMKRNGFPPIVLAMTPDGTWFGLYLDGKLYAEHDRFNVMDVVKVLGGEVRVVKLDNGEQFPDDVAGVYV